MLQMNNMVKPRDRDRVLSMYGGLKILFFFNVGFERFYLFIFIEMEREEERQWEKHRCAQDTSSIGCLLHARNWGLGPQPRHVPWPGIEPINLSVCRLAFNPLSHTSQGLVNFWRLRLRRQAKYKCNLRRVRSQVK